ncbi:AraC family transcriptional regulator [Pseudomonas sp. TKO26]|uniref:AraC family transcriptional regulator n=1 Tax=unclassified Pseudomonas TaxID=196821 RepID=UPI000D829E66|nr:MULTISPECIES: AraC family transcriptional regulator [unclassified Pseudomonas]PYY86384.1 AraC family transcriptional regulator [Pseudomonas sp. TKO30]PYY89135.1 AraC family transcriptional regulator [Pseudomonas sp. TKO29]PYY91808.1 AraC family transcriptional regulator [Pseudomonas sp. TKO26]PYY99917.1 AraC family transcriptional regulator [Pseudomonas sp. TKO14]
MKPATRIHYGQRMEPVLHWLASHPHSDPDLYHLADLACMSAYHFHRIYRAMMGETLNATVQRMRMHLAAAALAGTQEDLAEVALRAGYESGATFNRAFSGVFGVPPGRYRATRSCPFDPKESNMYPITIEHFPGVVLAALPHQGSYQEIGPVFTRVFMLAASQGLMHPTACGFGVYFNDPEQVPTEQLRSLAGVSVAPDADLGEKLERFEIPQGRYAMLNYVGPYNEMGKAYAWMFSEWLPESGLTPGNFPMFEQYVNDPRSTPPAQLQTRIYLSVE